MPDYFVRPYDVLFFRGNKSFHFGEWFTEGVFPPYPSTFQGFIRSKMLHDGEYFDLNGRLKPGVNAEDIVGNDERLSVSITGPYLMDRGANEIYFKTPEDLFGTMKGCNIYYSAFPGKYIPLESDQDFITACPNIPKEKPDNLYPPDYISMKALLSYRLSLRDIKMDGINPCLSEDRVGISLNTAGLRSGNRTVEKTKFYVTNYNRLQNNYGFYCSVNTELKEGSLKLGSESHLANVEKLNTVNRLKETLTISRRSLNEQILKTQTFRLVLLQHGVFTDGWLPFPHRIDDGTKRLLLFPDGFKLKLELIFAFTEAHLIISVYSFASNKTDGKQESRRLKRQVSAVPAGSVYMVRIQEGSDTEIVRFIDRFDNEKILYPPYSDMGFNHVMLACGAKINGEGE
ncbi:MAG: type III-B CRISPR module-associated Cmr3 family protein [Nitrospirota bacterium]